MKRILVLLIVVSGVFSCNKEKWFGGVNTYQDGFEYPAANALDSLLLEDDSRWTNEQTTYDLNNFEISDEQVHSGNYSLKCFAQQTIDGKASKCGLQKQNVSFYQGETVELNAWYYLANTEKSSFLVFMDLEEKISIGAGPGMRIFLDGEGEYLYLNRGKYGEPSIYQNESAKTVFPRNQWVKITLQVNLHKRKKGWVKMYQDDVLVLEADNVKTLPTDQPFGAQGTKGLYDSIEFGITANSSDNDVTMFVDDIDAKKL